jgi:hypothetical protein
MYVSSLNRGEYNHNVHIYRCGTLRTHVSCYCLCYLCYLCYSYSTECFAGLISLPLYLPGMESSRNAVFLPKHHGMAALSYGNCGGKFPLVLDLSTRWKRVASFTPQLFLLQRKNPWYRFVNERD